MNTTRPSQPSYDPSHVRGNGLPTSLESGHHTGADGEGVYSPAQREALRRQKDYIKRVTPPPTPDVAYMKHDRFYLHETARLVEPPVVEPSHEDHTLETTALETTALEVKEAPAVPGLHDPLGYR